MVPYMGIQDSRHEKVDKGSSGALLCGFHRNIEVGDNFFVELLVLKHVLVLAWEEGTKVLRTCPSALNNLLFDDARGLLYPRP
ncbi:hypothetical protein RJT34_20421 [Clitoria ternatea]|uniref:Uncharacterized protein n=1 Tax=Clitoria ternatea TaxID=43366 RepID=A0AAN9IT19_CLITE